MLKHGAMLSTVLCSMCILVPSAWAASTDRPKGAPRALPEAAPLPQAAAPGAPPIVIDFRGDTPGGKPNGFASVAARGVTFSDTLGADLEVGAFVEGHGQALAVFPDDESGLRITLARPTTRISLAFGNDDPCCSDPGDDAVLTLFRGALMVGEVRVPMNRNDVMDQTISYGPQALFDRAEFRYDVDPARGGLIEVVDDIVIAPLCTIAGIGASDVLNGTDGPDVICGGGGGDTINAKGGNDTVFAGVGNDRVDGGPGNDVLRGGTGNDVLVGGGGNDLLDGNEGRDLCDGGSGTDTARSCETRKAIP